MTGMFIENNRKNIPLVIWDAPAGPPVCICISKLHSAREHPQVMVLSCPYFDVVNMLNLAWFNMHEFQASEVFCRQSAHGHPVLEGKI